MYDLALMANEALFATHGEYYEPGCIACIIYTATGGALDWVYEIAGIPYTYTIELRDTGDYGLVREATKKKAKNFTSVVNYGQQILVCEPQKIAFLELFSKNMLKLIHNV